MMPTLTSTVSPSIRIDVPKTLSSQQVKAFVDDGYLIVPGLVRPAEVEDLRRDLLLLARGRYPCEGIQPAPDTMSDTAVLQNILSIHEAHHVSPVILKYVKHPSICGVLSQVAGAHLAHWDGSVKNMQSMFFVKPPSFQGQAWHQDEIYIPTRDRSLTGAWIALDDATVENGCLWVLPGSHRSGYLFPQRPHEKPDEFDFANKSFGFDPSPAIPVEVKTGSVVFFNGYLLHRSLKNRSRDCYRRVLVNHYMTASSLLPWHVKAGEPPATTDCRTVALVAGTDPYAWKGYEVHQKAVWLRTCKANTPPAAPTP